MNRVDAEAALEALAVLGLENNVVEIESGNKHAEMEAAEDPVLDLVGGEEAEVIRAPEEEGAVRLFESPRPA
jgi:hypothetical protein